MLLYSSIQPERKQSGIESITPRAMRSVAGPRSQTLTCNSAFTDHVSAKKVMSVATIARLSVIAFSAQDYKRHKENCPMTSYLHFQFGPGFSTFGVSAKLARLQDFPGISVKNTGD